MKDQEEIIARALSSLKAVEAPEGFEGVVRTRIAEGRKDETAAPTFWLVAKFALPMLLLVMLGVFFVVSDDGVVNVEMVPPVGSPSQVIADLPPSDVEKTDMAVAEASIDKTDVSSTDRAVPVPTSSPQGGSQDHTRAPDESAVFPEGVDPRNANIQGDDPPRQPITPLSILSFIGISGGCSPTSCAVRSVQEGSIAERSGVRPGDVIREIDGRAIDSFHSFTGNVTVTRLTVVRGGESISISIRTR